MNACNVSPPQVLVALLSSHFLVSKFYFPATGFSVEVSEQKLPFACFSPPHFIVDLSKHCDKKKKKRFDDVRR